ncbi:MAG: hypothetical protein LBB12_04180 [Holosporaceae bacterium]|jgi:hypothetical protein|nr:hypothetical protein [Holosporaceae bacterium]
MGFFSGALNFINGRKKSLPKQADGANSVDLPNKQVKFELSSIKTKENADSHAVAQDGWTFSPSNDTSREKKTWPQDVFCLRTKRTTNTATGAQNRKVSATPGNPSGQSNVVDGKKDPLHNGLKNTNGDGNPNSPNTPIVEPMLDIPMRTRMSWKLYLKELLPQFVTQSFFGWKVIKGISFAIIGIVAGSVCSLILCIVLLQFGSLENTVLSSIVEKHFEEVMPDSDLSIKTASLQWNSDHKAFEINLKRVRIDDFVIPNIAIIPDYLESLRRQRFVTRSVSLINAKIKIDIADNLSSVSLSIGSERGAGKSAVLKPVSELCDLTKILDENVVVSFVSADVVIAENGVIYTPQNLYCEYLVGQRAPRLLSFSIVLPHMPYRSEISIEKEEKIEGNVYDVKINSLNPHSIYHVLLGRDTPFNRLLPLIEGYNLPLSGVLKFRYDGNRLLDCTFNLSASAGTIRLLKNDSLALVLGKKIDSGNVSGTITTDKLLLDNLSILYGNSGIGMTNISVPMNDFVTSGAPSVNGLLSLTNINIREMCSILPENVCKNITQLLKNCLPVFKMESFQIDLDGPLCLKEDSSDKKLKVGTGIFKIKDAKISIGDDLITNVNATGSITNDGLEMQLSGAKLRSWRLNNGTLFLSRKDNSWKSEMNIRMAKNGASLENDASQNKDEIEGDINVPMDQNLVNTQKPTQVAFDIVCKSDCVKKLFAIMPQYLNGNIMLTINNSYDGQKELFALTADLKSATVALPLFGVVKQIDEEGTFKVNIAQVNDNLECSDLQFSSANTQIAGKLCANMNWNIKKCSFNKFDITGCSAKLTLQQKDVNHFSLSILGDSLNACKFTPIVDLLDKDISLSTYVNLREVVLSPYRKLNNVKGNIEISHNSIVGGTGIAVYRENATLALSIKPVNKSSDSLISISASDAGEFLRYIGISDCLSGGTLNIVFKLPDGKIAEGPLSGGFEIADFVFANCESLNKLVSLSSPIVVPKEGLSLGCNFFMGNVIISEDILALKGGRVVSPSMAFTLDVNYDRKKDDFTIKGLSLYLASLINNNNLNGVFASEYKGTGSIYSPSISVKAMKFVTYDELGNIFGNILPTPTSSVKKIPKYQRQNVTMLSQRNARSDPFASRAFDEEQKNIRPMDSESNDDDDNIVVHKNKKNNEKKIVKYRIIDRKTGVVINRGAQKKKHKKYRKN